MYKYILLAVVVSLAAAVEQCPANEEYRECGTACPTTCANRHDGPKPCILLCVPGCFCKEGFFRHSQGHCVREEECDGHVHVPLRKTCEENEEYQDCGTPCPRTCENRNDKTPRPCPAMCVAGCQCKQGFFKNKAGKCVPEELCDGHTHVPIKPSQTCGENERFTNCGSACPVTCANRFNNPKFCTLQCVIGCECKPGFMKNGAGKCVKETECEDQVSQRSVRANPKDCKVNEEFQQCASTCPRTCANRNQGPLICNKMCKLNSCECKSGFVRDANGECVRGEQCDASCTGKNEVLTACTAHCQPKCGVKEPQICTLMCKPGCTCRDGYARDSEGQCVKREDCPDSDAKRSDAPGPNEVFSPCAAHCTPKCNNRRPICDRRCVPGFTCAKGFFRNEDGRCVTPEEC